VDDTITTLRRKVRAATIFGTIQATATKFPGLRPQWQQNAERERLLGVDITGQMDCPLLTGRRADRVFAELRELSREVNDEMARVLGIAPAAAITTVKPAGNSAALLNCGSGVHGRHSRFYVRNARVSAHSPVYKVLRDAGAPLSPENGQDAGTASTWVCAFPCRAPEGAVLKADLPARAQLAHWLLNKRHWTDHNPSCTITYRPEEEAELIAWVKAHREEIGGISFLPAFDAAYEQMPYVEVDEAEYERRLAAFPAIDWSRIALYEQTDTTTSAQELVCTGDRCELK
jgi:ribonucleoside-diphosphate reductase alpha chain